MNAPGQQVPVTATGEEWRNNTRKNEETEPKQKKKTKNKQKQTKTEHPVVDVTDDGSKVRCCKEQYCTGTWNVRSMIQGKLEVVKQEIGRAHV